MTVHEELVHAPNGGLDKGDELSQKLKVAGQAFKVSWKISTAHRPHDIEWEGRGPLGTKARVSYDLEPRGDGTCFNYVNEYAPARRAARKAGRKGVQEHRLKRSRPDAR